MLVKLRGHSTDVNKTGVWVTVKVLSKRKDVFRISQVKQDQHQSLGLSPQSTGESVLQTGTRLRLLEAEGHEESWENKGHRCQKPKLTVCRCVWCVDQIVLNSHQELSHTSFGWGEYFGDRIPILNGICKVWWD